MHTFIALVFIVLGFALLVKGADWLVDGASALAGRFGVTPIVIGLTVVAFGTSMPELTVNLLSVYQGSTDLAIANVVGSNIANILLILGVAALIYPLRIKENTAWKEIPLALLAVTLLGVMVSDAFFTGRSANGLDRIDGLVFLSFFIIFLYYTFGISKAEGEGDPVPRLTLWRSLFLVLFGIFGLVLGGKLAVDGAISLSGMLGLSERIIGLTVVAIGTSLPELVTSAVAAYRKHADIAVGNVVGSNIFNVFWILGLSSTIRPLPFGAETVFDVWVAIVAALALFFAVFVGQKHVLERWQGGVMLGGYVSYLAWLAVSAS